jgi:hypothetical protein
MLFVSSKHAIFLELKEKILNKKTIHEEKN